MNEKCKGQACASPLEFTIVGRASDGSKFRPASAGLEWSQRIAGWLSVGERVATCRVCMSPSQTEDGTPTLRVFQALRLCQPEVWEQVVDFALDNGLEIEAPT